MKKIMAIGKLLTWLLILLPLPLSAAQDFSMPSDEQMAKAVDDAKGVFNRLDPAYQGLDKAPIPDRKIPVAPASPAGTKNFTLRDLMMKTPVATAAPPEKRNTVELMVFVTLALPKETMRLLAGQAKRAGATLVLRGLKNDSLKDTASALRAISEKAAWQINPPAFSRFGIKSVPAFVLARAAPLDAGKPSEGCAQPQSFVSVSGDVSLDFALETFEKESPAFRADAVAFLQKMKARE